MDTVKEGKACRSNDLLLDRLRAPFSNEGFLALGALHQFRPKHFFSFEKGNRKNSQLILTTSTQRALVAKAVTRSRPSDIRFYIYEEMYSRTSS